MNRLSKYSLLLLAFLYPALPLLAQDDAKAIIDRAVKAIGGADKIAAYPAGKVKANGKYFLGGQTYEFKQESVHMMPDMIREKSELNMLGQNVTMEILYDGEAVQVFQNGKAIEAKKLEEIKRSLNQSVHLMNVNRLITLGSSKYKLKTIDGKSMEGQDCVGVQVDADGFEPIKLYFNKTTGLPAGSEMKVMDADTKKNKIEERRLIEFMDVQGIKVAKKAKVMNDGALVTELVVTETEFMKSADKMLFKKP